MGRRDSWEISDITGEIASRVKEVCNETFRREEAMVAETDARVKEIQSSLSTTGGSTLYPGYSIKAEHMLEANHRNLHELWSGFHSKVDGIELEVWNKYCASTSDPSSSPGIAPNATGDGTSIALDLSTHSDIASDGESSNDPSTLQPPGYQSIGYTTLGLDQSHQVPGAWVDSGNEDSSNSTASHSNSIGYSRSGLDQSYQAPGAWIDSDSEDLSKSTPSYSKYPNSITLASQFASVNKYPSSATECGILGPNHGQYIAAFPCSMATRTEGSPSCRFFENSLVKYGNISVVEDMSGTWQADGRISYGRTFYNRREPTKTQVDLAD